MRIAIVGIGSMGSLFAARLAATGHELFLAGHWQEQLDALHHQLMVLEADGTWSEHGPFAAGPWPPEGYQADLVLILCKSSQTFRAGRLARKILAEDGFVLTLQNGSGNYDLLADVVGEERCLAGVSGQTANLFAPGMVKDTGKGMITLHGTTGKAQYTSRAVTLLQQGSFEVSLAPDFPSLYWSSLVTAAAIQPLSAVLNLEAGALAEREDARRCMLAIVQEGIAVAQAQNIELDLSEDPAIYLANHLHASAAARPSMLEDVLRGVPTEVVNICCPILQAGKRLGVATPITQSLTELVIQLENGWAKPDPQTVLPFVAAG